MTRAHLFTVASAALATLVLNASAVAQSDPNRVELVVGAGTPLRVALDDTVAVKQVGQVVHGTLIEPLYAYDRMVLPIGTRVVGHVASLENPSKLVRLRAWSNGDFTPKRASSCCTRRSETIAACW
jgi:phosphosulfolactate phosphohydrolase-like enzyme